MATKSFSDVSGKETKLAGITLFDNDRGDYGGDSFDLTLTEKKEFKRLVQNFVKNKKLNW